MTTLKPTTDDHENDRLLTIEEVGDYIGTPVATLRWWRHNGVGPKSFRLGRRVFYWLSDVLRWVEEAARGDGPHAA